MLTCGKAPLHDDFRNVTVGKEGIGFHGISRTLVSKGRGSQEFDGDVEILPGADGFANGALGREREREGSGFEGLSPDGSGVENAGDQEVGGIGKTKGLLGSLYLLGGVGGENFKVAENMAAIKATSAELDIKIGGLWKPKLLAARAEANSGIIDGNMLTGETDFFDGLDQIGFEMEDLIAARIDPSAAGQQYRIRNSVDDVRPERVALVRPLLEMNEPGWMSPPLAEPFAREMKALREGMMKDQGVGGEI